MTKRKSPLEPHQLDEATECIRSVFDTPDNQHVVYFVACSVKSHRKNNAMGIVYFTKQLVCFIGKRKLFSTDFNKVFVSNEITDISYFDGNIRIKTHRDKKYIFSAFPNDDSKGRVLRTLRRMVYGISGDSPLHKIIQNPKTEDRSEKIVTLLTEDHNQLMQNNLNEFTPLHLAIKTNDVPIFKLLLSFYEMHRDLDINMQLPWTQKFTVLHAACSSPVDDSIIVALLNFEYIDVTVRNTDENTPLHYFCECTQSLDCVEIGNLLIEKGADVNFVNNRGETPLHKAVFNRHCKVLLVDMLVPHKIQVNFQNEEWQDTPLHYATRMARKDISQRLIAAGGDITIKNKQSLTPVQLAHIQLEDYQDNQDMDAVDNMLSILAMFRDIENLRKVLEEAELSDYFSIFIQQELYQYDIFVSLTKDTLIAEPLNMKIGASFRLLKCIESFQNEMALEIQEADEIDRKKREALSLFSNREVFGSEGLIVEIDVDPSMDIPFDALEFTEKLASGGSGQVLRGLWNKMEVAIKVLHSENIESEIEEFKQEIEIMKGLNSKYLVKLFGASFDKHLCMVMEFCERGSLFDVLKSHHTNFTWELALSMAKDTAKGMEVLHNLAILHRDMKSLNLLVTKNWEVKVGDFGLSRVRDRNNMETFNKLRGTFAYCAPELYHGGSASDKSDIFSVGIIFWELIYVTMTKTYTTPYQEYGLFYDFQILLQAANGLRPNIPINSPMSFVELYLECTNADPSTRPSATELVERLTEMKKIFSNDPEEFLSTKFKGDIKFSLRTDLE